jgi:AraC-like DNA-binding protein
VDVLSDMIAATRVGRPHSSLNSKHAPWGTRFEPFAGAGFHAVLRGSCWLVPLSGDAVRLRAGDVVFLPHGRGHVLADSPTTTPTRATAATSPNSASAMAGPLGPDATILLCGGYLFDRGRPNPLLDQLPDAIHLPAAIGDRRTLHAAIGLLRDELEQPLHGSTAVVPALLDAMLLYILRAWLADADQADQADEAGHCHHATAVDIVPGATATSTAAATATGWPAAFSDPAILSALTAIHQAPAQPWTVDALANHATLSRAAFARRFTACVGQPPMAYLTWWRMTLAARSLRETDAPIAAVAQQVGYASPFAFANAFKRALGTAPGRYRRDAR